MQSSSTRADTASMTASMEIVKGLSSLDVSINTKGQKTAAILRNGQPATWTFASPAIPLFQPSTYQAVVTSSTSETSQKLTLCLNVQPDVLAEAEAIDAWGIQYAFNNSDRLFGKKLTLEQVMDRYSPIVKKTEKYPPYLKVKLADRNDRHAPSYWGMDDKKKREAPQNWQKRSLQCHCRLVGFWIMSTSFGISVQLCDALVDDTESVCPL